VQVFCSWKECPAIPKILETHLLCRSNARRRKFFDRHDDRRQDQQSPKIVGNTPLHYDPATHVEDTAVPRKRSSSDPGLWLGKQCDHRLGKTILPQTTHYKCLTTQAYAVESVDHTTFLSHPKRAVLLHTPVPTPSEFSVADNLSASDVDELIQAMMDDGSVRDTQDVHRELREKVFSDTSNIGLQCKEVVHKKAKEPEDRDSHSWLGGRMA
jgi:hypothetical protein